VLEANEPANTRFSVIYKLRYLLTEAVVFFGISAVLSCEFAFQAIALSSLGVNKICPAGLFIACK